MVNGKAHSMATILIYYNNFENHSAQIILAFKDVVYLLWGIHLNKQIGLH